MTKTKPISCNDGAKLQPESSRKSDKPSKAEANPKTNKYLPLHQTNGHDAKECKDILAQAKYMQFSYEAGGATHANHMKADFQKKKKEQMYSFMVNAFQ
jgi:hypothetical protein